MQNIYTVIDDLLKLHSDEEFEVSELLDAPVLSITVKDGVVTSEGTCSQQEAEYAILRAKFEQVLPVMRENFTLIGYVVNGEFLLFSMFMEGAEVESTPTQRHSFLQLYNASPFDIRVRHTPIDPLTMKLDGARAALSSGTDYETVKKYTLKAITGLSGGVSKATNTQRKGLVFKSFTTPFSFKVYNEHTLMTMGSL